MNKIQKDLNINFLIQKLRRQNDVVFLLYMNKVLQYGDIPRYRLLCLFYSCPSQRKGQFSLLRRKKIGRNQIFFGYRPYTVWGGRSYLIQNDPDQLAKTPRLNVKIFLSCKVYKFILVNLLFLFYLQLKKKCRPKKNLQLKFY